MPKVQFRDGERNVPDHVAELLRSVETYKLTYDQSMAAANNRLLADEVHRRVNNLLREHFRKFER